MKQKNIALVDCNNFFVSCEQLRNPKLENKPVCVLSNNNGCVISRSNEAKQLGIKMGSPYFMAKKEFPDAIYLSSDFALYHEMSSRIRKKFKNYTSEIEIYSIDEAFLNLTNINKLFKTDYLSLITKIRNEIKQETGIWVSVGLANSKVLAKIATDKAKKGNGTYIIEKGNIRKELGNINIKDIWGIGKNTTRFFNSYGIFQALDIIEKDDAFLKYHIGKRGLELKYELMGESVIAEVDNTMNPKSIQKSSAFPNFSTDKEYIKSTLHFHLHNVCSKMRKLNLTALEIGVMLRTKDFKVFYLAEKLDECINTEFILQKITDKLFDKIFYKDIIYRASGIYAGNFSNYSISQYSLFPKNDIKTSEKISSVWDKLENKYGKGIIRLGLSNL